MEIITFDPNGQPLWISIDMRGIYSVVYNYQLIGTDGQPLTRPLLKGDNIRSNDDDFSVKNDLQKEKGIALHDERTLEVSFMVFKLADDYGYKLSAYVLQGKSPDTSTIIGKASLKGKLGDEGIKEEKLIIQLKSA